MTCGNLCGAGVPKTGARCGIDSVAACRTQARDAGPRLTLRAPGCGARLDLHARAGARRQLPGADHLRRCACVAEQHLRRPPAGNPSLESSAVPRPHRRGRPRLRHPGDAQPYGDLERSAAGGAPVNGCTFSVKVTAGPGCRCAPPAARRARRRTSRSAVSRRWRSAFPSPATQRTRRPRTTNSSSRRSMRVAASPCNPGAREPRPSSSRPGTCWRLT